MLVIEDSADMGLLNIVNGGDYCAQHSVARYNVLLIIVIFI